MYLPHPQRCILLHGTSLLTINMVHLCVFLHTFPAHLWVENKNVWSWFVLKRKEFVWGSGYVKDTFSEMFYQLWTPQCWNMLLPVTEWEFCLSIYLESPLLLGRSVKQFSIMSFWFPVWEGNTSMYRIKPQLRSCFMWICTWGLDTCFPSWTYVEIQVASFLSSVVDNEWGVGLRIFKLEGKIVKIIFCIIHAR